MIFKKTGNKAVDKAYKHFCEGLSLLKCCESPYGSVKKQEEVDKLMKEFIEKLEKL